MEETEEEMEAEEEGQVPDLEDQDWMSACCSEEAVSFFSALATTVGSTEEGKLCSEAPVVAAVALPATCTMAQDMVYSAPPPPTSQPPAQAYQQVQMYQPQPEPEPEHWEQFDPYLFIKVIIISPPPYHPLLLHL